MTKSLKVRNHFLFIFLLIPQCLLHNNFSNGRKNSFGVNCSTVQGLVVIINVHVKKQII